MVAAAAKGYKDIIIVICIDLGNIKIQLHFLRCATAAATTTAAAAATTTATAGAASQDKEVEHNCAAIIYKKSPRPDFFCNSARAGSRTGTFASNGLA